MSLEGPLPKTLKKAIFPWFWYKLAFAESYPTSSPYMFIRLHCKGQCKNSAVTRMAAGL